MSTRLTRRRYLVVLLGVALLVAVAGGGLVVFEPSAVLRGSPPPPPPSHPVPPQPAHQTTVAVRYDRRPDGWTPKSGLAGATSLVPPFRQCPPVGADTGCATLLQVTSTGQVAIRADADQLPYDRFTGATLVGVLNSSPAGLRELTLTADSGLFSGGPRVTGPGVSFADDNGDGHRGTVRFRDPVPPGGTAWFVLAQAPAASVATAGSPTFAEQGGAPSPSLRTLSCGATLTVNCASGVFSDRYTDISVAGRGAPLNLTRTYTSARAALDSRFGYGWVDSYALAVSTDSTGVTVHEESGAAVTFQPDGRGGFTAPARVFATLSRDADGRLVFARRADPVRYVFDGAGRLVDEHDAAGETTKLEYTGDRLTKVTDPAGRALVLKYIDGHVSQATGPGKRIRHYEYTGGVLTRVSDDIGHEWGFEYDTRHRMTVVHTSLHTPLHHQRTVTYDPGGRVVRQEGPVPGARTTWTYRGDGTMAQGGTTTMTDPEGAVTVYEYASLELTAVTRGSGTDVASTTRYTYGPAARVTSVTDGEGHRTRYGYTTSGDLKQLTDAGDHVTTYTYDAGKVTEVDGPLPGVSVHYAYDRYGNVHQVTDGNGKNTTYTYDDKAHPGDLSWVEDPVHHVTTLHYDPAGNVRSSTVYPSAGKGATTTYEYDDAGNVTATTDPMHSTTKVSYNQADQPEHIIDAAGHTTSFNYDFEGNPLLTTDRDNHPIHYEYDEAGRPTKVIRPDSSTTVTGYDLAGHVKRQIDPAGQATRYEYDALGRVTSTTDPLGRTTRFGYDRAGNETTLTDPSGRVTRYEYDETNHLVKVVYSDNTTPTVKYTYDEAGRRKSMTDASGKTAYWYDGVNRLVAVTDGAGQTVGYGYDDAGDLTKLAYPNGNVTRRYDHGGRLASIEDWLGNRTRFGYDDAGNLTTRTLPNGIVVSYGTGVTATLGGSTKASFTYQRDDAGQITSASTTTGTGPATTNAYTYDKLNRLDTLNGQHYGYDKAGNLERWPDGGTQSFDAAGQLKTAGDSKYEYDPEGNRSTVTTGANTTTLRYDQANRLTDFDTEIHYGYDGDGQRVSATTYGSKAAFAWDRSAQTPLLLSDGARAYVYGPDGQPIEQIATDGTPTYLLTDGQGSVRVLTDDKGNVTGTRDYDPYGRPTRPVDDDSPLGYAGQYTDPGTGLQYLHARYYDPATAQFITRDPTVALTRAPFSYAANNPLNAADPSGLDWYDPLVSLAKKAWSAVVHTVYALKTAIGALVGWGVFAGCEALAAAAGEGVAAIPAIPICGAVAGALGEVVEYLLGAAESGNFSWSELGESALGGAVGGLLLEGGGGKVLKRLPKKLGRVLKRKPAPDPAPTDAEPVPVG